MIYVDIKGQKAKVRTPFIASDTIKYLEASFTFQGEKWKEASKIAVFQDSKGNAYTRILKDDKITSQDNLDLTEGQWLVGVVGTLQDGTRITTDAVPFVVNKAVRTDGEVLPPIQPTMAEQILAKAENAERIAQSVRDDADNGLFKGDKGDPYEHSVEFETLSKQVRDDALKSAQSEKNASVSATKSEQSATASEASAKASETSSVNAKTSETNAKGSENQSAQNLEDLISMLGTQVATLVDGKIPLDQIPATATVENYVIKSEDELITLTAQKGDVAHLVEDVEGKKTITKTWQLLGTDSKVKDNWILWGTSYAVQAGYATIAGTSNDSERINGMRFVTMNYSDFETAVKDPNTLYAVDMGV